MDVVRSPARLKEESRRSDKTNGECGESRHQAEDFLFSIGNGGRIASNKSVDARDKQTVAGNQSHVASNHQSAASNEEPVAGNERFIAGNK